MQIVFVAIFGWIFRLEVANKKIFELKF